MRFRVLGRTVSVALSGLLFSGCTTQRIRFTSVPPGAEVRVGGRRGVTPCILKLPKDAETATFRLPSGEEKVLPLPEPENVLEETADGAGTVLGGTLMFAGGLVAAGGLGLFLLGAADLTNDRSDIYDHQDDDDDEDAYAAVGIGLAAMAVGGGAFWLGRWMLPDRVDGELQAVFDEAGSAEPVYEEAEFGARRIKRAGP